MDAANAYQVPEHIVQVLDTFDVLGASPTAELIRESSDNEVYRVRGNVDGVLRVSKRTNLADIGFEVEAINHLAQRGVAVPHVLPGRSGSPVVTAPDGRAVVLFAYIPGDPADAGAPGLSARAAAGRLLAQIHLAGQDFLPTKPRSRTAWTEF